MPKLGIKGTSRKENYDLMFEGSDGESDKGEHFSKKHSKRKKDNKVLIVLLWLSRNTWWICVDIALN